MLASGSLDRTVRLWDATTWANRDELRHGSEVYGVAFSADDKLLACACANNLVRFWNVDAGRELAELSGHKDYVHHVTFSPDGTRMVSASGDRTLRVWDTLPRAEREPR
jgi:WD40 repeat protein